jgi:serine/threonine-protein kinase
MQRLPKIGPGHVIAGRYRVEGLVGEGGFGAVYRATQLNIGRTVALKVLQPDLVAHADSESRFTREAELAQRLEHPNTVRLFDFGRSEEGIPFIAFELLKGQPLDERLQSSGPMPAATVARITTQMLKSLMEAHGLGVVHRDIKPANIFLCDYPGEPDFVKVLDFGIAKALDDNKPGGRGALTRVGTAIGTPNYMAPEQVGAGTIGPHTDLYSVGLVMAEMLGGQVVFQGDSAVQICMDQISPAPVPLLPEVLQSPLGSVIHRATQKAAERRYASAEEMLRDLESVASSLATGAARVSAEPAAGAAMAYAPTNVFGAQGPGGYAPPPGGHGGYTPAPAGYAPAPGGYGSAPGYAPAAAFAPTMQPSLPMGAPPMGAAPMGASPYGAHPPKQGSGCSTGIIVLVAGGGLALVAVLALVLVFVFGISAGGVAGGGGLPGGGGPPGGGTSTGPVGFDGIAVEALEARVKQAGYTPNSRSVSESGGADSITITFTRGNEGGSVTVVDYQDPSIAEIAESSMREGGRLAVARDGAALMMVMTFPSQGEQQALLVKLASRR